MIDTPGKIELSSEISMMRRAFLYDTLYLHSLSRFVFLDVPVSLVRRKITNDI
ncbi:hypothetical protein BVSY1_38990 [Bacillus velezensis]|nr:hypothetical protein BVSY1_38990 [Bacillus velezensis]